MAARAWEKQSQSLVEVQKRGTGLEQMVRQILGWEGGRVVYDRIRQYKLQTDAAYPSMASPDTIVSVTYTDPDTRGHSNENKFHLKVGELVLLKGAYPDVRMVLAIGGSGDAWLSYVLRAFQVFYDEVLFLWQEADRERLASIGTSPESCQSKHRDFWRDVHHDRSSRVLAPDGWTVPCCSVRYEIADVLRTQVPVVHNPSLVHNPIARLCMRRSFEHGGAEWRNYLKGQWHSIEMSRNYFNPLEAAVELTLTQAGLEFEGGVARDVAVPSMLHDLGMTETSLSEDFVLFSEKLDLPVYIQCKASGGGRKQHGKNIQNRTKEQTTRSILYTCSASPDGTELTWKGKTFHWISVLDGDWGVTRAEPLKYIHMLQLAGYDRIFCAKDLLTDELDVRAADNPLTRYLVDELGCRRRR